MRPALLLVFLEVDRSRQELLCLAGGGTDAEVAVDLHCVDRRGQDSRTCVMLDVLDETDVGRRKLACFIGLRANRAK